MSAHDPTEPLTSADPTTADRDVEGSDGIESAPAPARRRSGLDDRGRVKRTRAATAWAAAVALALALILLIALIVQNSEPITVAFLWLEGDLPAAAALLIAAVAGALLVAIPGAVRITQLRRSLRRNG